MAAVCSSISLFMSALKYYTKVQKLYPRSSLFWTDRKADTQTDIKGDSCIPRNFVCREYNKNPFQSLYLCVITYICRRLANVPRRILMDRHWSQEAMKISVLCMFGLEA